VAEEEAGVLAAKAAKAPVVADMAAARRALAVDTAVAQPMAKAVPQRVDMAVVTQAGSKRGPSMPPPRRMAPE
jgi:hypothetical protein